ncbi:MAG: thioredoxin family protein, partial [Spirochaetota bacterium]
MAATPSAMLPLGTQAPDFTLPGVDGKTVSRKQYDGKPLLVAFICNHCPFVKHIIDAFVEKATEYRKKGVGVVAINANDVDGYPEDDPEHMRVFASGHGLTFPYLFDEDQSVARAYQAACTPDFFLFDKDHKLFYRGQFDAARPGNDEGVTGADLTAAVNALVAGKPA